MRASEVRLAMRSAAALYAVGAVLLAFASVVDDHNRAGVITLTALAVAVGFLLLTIDRAGRGSLRLVFGADLLAAAMIATFVALTDGAHSPSNPYFVLVALHVAVFQPRARVVVATALATAAFLAPLLYDQDAGWFARVAIPGLILSLVLVWVIHLVVSNLRRERRSLAVREAEALRIAESDELTGIGNYRRFWRALQSEVARSRRHDHPFSLLVLDLDGFKAINDELGHQAGDEALRRVARALEGEVRAEDVLCRQGGDEFGVIAVAAPASEAGELARRLVEAVTEAGRGLARPLSASAGWATFGDPERTAEGLLARADQALRSAKPGREPGTPAVLPMHGRRPSEGPPDEHSVPADRRLAALSACSRALALAPDERSVVQIAVVHVAEALEAGSVELWRRHGSHGEPVLVARGRHAGSLAPPAPPVAIEELEAVMAANHVVALDGQGLIVPVSYEGAVEGALVVQTARDIGAELEVRRLALAMAAQIGRALAVAKARADVGNGHPAELERLAAAAGGGPEARRVVELAVAAGRDVGLTDRQLTALREAALLHNIGMLGIPVGLPLRPNPLTPEEVEVLHQHPIIAQRVLGSMPRLADAARILRHSHERHDGTGYPDGLSGDEIPMASRVLHAAVAYAAMREPRPWRPALDPDDARDELAQASGTQLDPEAADAVLRAVDARRRSASGA